MAAVAASLEHCRREFDSRHPGCCEDDWNRFWGVLSHKAAVNAGLVSDGMAPFQKVEPQRETVQNLDYLAPWEGPPTDGAALDFCAELAEKSGEEGGHLPDATHDREMEEYASPERKSDSKKVALYHIGGIVRCITNKAIGVDVGMKPLRWLPLSQLEETEWEQGDAVAEIWLPKWQIESTF